MAINTVRRRVQPAAHEPLEERRIAGVDDLVPLLVPRQQVRVLDEAVGEMLRTEPLENRLVVGVRVSPELLRRLDVLLLTPVDRDLVLRVFLSLGGRLGRL